MSKLIRFFRQIFRPNQDQSSKKASDGIEYIINHLLDEPPYKSHIPKSCTANEIFREFYTYIGLFNEQDYFGLKNKENIWIDPLREIHKQVKSKPPHELNFCVKFYPSDPQNLRDEFARYLMVQQVSNDILTGKLNPDNLDLIADLSALLLQSWYGPFDPNDHSLAFIKSHQFLPKEKCTDSFYNTVFKYYQKNSYRKLVPADAEKLFLNKVTQISQFGVDWHEVEGKKKSKITLGLTPSGILVYEKDACAGMFYWNNIDNIVLKWKKITIFMSAFNDKTAKMESSEFVFRSTSHDKTKELFKSCAEHHMFYQLASSQKNNEPSKAKGLFRRNSLFTLSSKTEFEMHLQRSLGSRTTRDRLSYGPTSKNDGKTKEALSRSHTSHSFKRTPSRGISMKKPENTFKK